MRTFVKQYAKQIAFNVGKVHLHVQTGVNVHNDCWIEDEDNVFE